MPDIGRFSAWITIDGTRATEYNVVSENSNATSCWIPSEVGKEFAVNWRDITPTNATRGDVKIDGNWMGALLIRDSVSLDSRTASLKGFLSADTEERPFLFSNTELTDDDAYLHSTNAADIGTIELVLKRVGSIKNSGPATPRSYNLPSTSEKVHERSKKGSSHSVQLGQAKQTKRSFVDAVPLDILPVAKFVFKYRPLDILQAQDIAPRNASAKRKATAEPDADDDGDNNDVDVKPDVSDAESDDAAELKALEERVNTLRERRANRGKLVKRENQADLGLIDLTANNKNAGRVKRDRKPVFLPGEVIDLT